MSLKHSYTLLAPFYDAIVAKSTSRMRQDSLAGLGDVSGKKILLAGVGSGLDFAHLPKDANYVGIDITPAMLQQARRRIPAGLSVELQIGDVTNMPFAADSFDIVISHLILAVVPKPEKMLLEVERVLKPGGEVLILDKFLRPGQLALMRRLLNLLIRHIATRTDVVFEEIIAKTPQLHVISDEPVIVGGWFRRIKLKKQTVT